MRTLLAKKIIRVYIAIGMIVLLTVIVDNALGYGPTCGPCDFYDWDGYWWRCAGCVVDCGSCYDCNTSTTPPSCEYRCNALECKHCFDCAEGCRSYCYPSECKTCDGNGNCVVCGGIDPNMVCCYGECYDIRTQRCCTETSPPHICDINESCCNGTCCPPNKCCDSPEVGPPYCKPKCDPDKPCYFQWPPVETPRTGCRNPDPEDKSCDIVEGSICAWTAESYYLTSAECASCAPNCSRNLVGYCVKLTPWKCHNEFVLFMGNVCTCNANGAGEPHDAGPHYTCL
jgi:hypothetical protein